MSNTVSKQATAGDPVPIPPPPPASEGKCADLCDCLLRFHQILTQTKPPTLMRAELFTLTGDEDNKDGDTAIFVSVKTSNNKVQLASVSNADASGKDMTEYNDDSYHIVPLVVDSPGSTKDECARFNVRLMIKTHGADTWTIDIARVTLFFTDGTNLVAERTSFDLVDDAALVDFSAP
jgi:hypothetical protein